MRGPWRALVLRWGSSSQCPGAVMQQGACFSTSAPKQHHPCSQGVCSLWCCLLFLPVFSYVLWFITARKCTGVDGYNQADRAFERGKSNSGSFMKKRWLKLPLNCVCTALPRTISGCCLKVPRAVEVRLQEIKQQTIGTYFRRKKHKHIFTRN